MGVKSSESFRTSGSDVRGGGGRLAATGGPASILASKRAKHFSKSINRKRDKDYDLKQLQNVMTEEVERSASQNRKCL